MIRCPIYLLQVDLKVEDVDRKFSDLAELERGGWQEPDVRPVLKKAAALPRKPLPAPARKPAVSGRKNEEKPP